MFPHIVKPVPTRRDELLDVAQRLFARNGYDEAALQRTDQR